MHLPLRSLNTREFTVTTKLTEQQWKLFAKRWARIAHNDYFPSRIGSFVDKDLDIIILFNNWPYENYPDLRGEQLATFREYLRKQGIKELAYATYPAETGYPSGLTVTPA
jgi:hypothetical protein